MPKHKRRIYRNNPIHKYVLLFVFFVFLMGVGYSVLDANLSLIGNIGVSGNDGTLYGVLKRAASKGTYAKEYSGEHNDSINSSLSTKKIYYWNASTQSVGSEIAEKNNVIFADHCWQMLRTTDTGGVKMIYNGRAEDNKCLDNRGNQIGYGDMSVINPSASYYYGTSYTYNSDDGKFYLDGVITTGEIKLKQYTCSSSQSGEGCSTLSYIHSNKNGDEYNAILLNSNTHYSQIGTLPFNLEASSVGDVGYKYGDSYSYGKDVVFNSKRIDETKQMFTTKSYSSVSSRMYVSNEISWDENTGNYSLVNQSFGSNTISTANYAGKYTFFKTSTSSEPKVYYIVSLEYTQSKVYVLELTGGKTLSDYEPFMFGDSLVDNGNGTYTIANPQQLSVLEWYSNYNSYNSNLAGYYTCGTDVTCASPHLIVYKYNDSYVYIDLSKEFVLARSFEGNHLVDTITITYNQLNSNFSSYKNDGYKYSCGNNLDICEGNPKILIGMKATDYSLSYKYLDLYYLGSSITWDGSNYTLVDPVDSENNYNNSLVSTHHYMCLPRNSTTCTQAGYVYFYNINDSNTIKYVILNNGEESVSTVLSNMLEKNSNDSIIKEGIDLWYDKNLSTKSMYLEDAVYCNDRSIIDIRGWDENTFPTAFLKFKTYNSTTSLKCSKIQDSFSVSNNQAKLNNPVGLLSVPEKVLSGSGTILSTGQDYWLMSAASFSSMNNSDERNTYGRYITSTGALSSTMTRMDSSMGVRPVISLKPDIAYSSGDGSKNNPYIVNTN